MLRYRLLLAAIVVCLLTAALNFPADFIANLRNRLQEFWSGKSNTRIHLAFNQPEYVGGDTARFSALVLDRQTLRPATGNAIVNIKLIQPSGTERLFNRFLCTEGIGSCQLVLPAGIEPGDYLLQAYTDESVQRNDPTSVFVTELRIGGEKELTTVEPESWFSDGIILNSWIGNRGGVVIQTQTREKEKTITVNLQIAEGSAWRNETLFLILSARGKIFFSSPFTFGSELLQTMVIDYSQYPAGQAAVTVFSPTESVLAERLVYLAPPKIQVRITPDAAEYPVRKRVSLEIALNNLNENPVTANASITVYHENAFPPNVRMPEAEENLLLNAELESPSFHVPRAAGTDPFDAYLLTRKLRTSWQEIISSKNSVAFSASNKPYYFKGRVNSATQTVPDSTQVTCYIPSYDMVYRVYTKGGAIEFPLFTEDEIEDLYYRISYKGKELKNASIELAQSPTVNIQASGVKQGEQADPYAAFSIVRGPILQSFDYYAKKASGKPNVGTYLDLDFDFDFETTFGKYKDFVSIREALIEVVPTVRPRRSGNRDLVQVFIKETAMFATEDPLFIIDGVITDSTKFFLDLPPSRVKRIMVLRSETTLNRFGELGKNGIIVVETRNPGGVVIPRSRHNLRINGISKPLPFRSPDHSAGSAIRTPDLRTTLYWNPHLEINQDGKATVSFFTSDATGPVRVRVDGVTTDGVPVHGEVIFAVKAGRP